MIDDGLGTIPIIGRLIFPDQEIALDTISVLEQAEVIQ